MARRRSFADEQSTYFDAVTYRGATHPVVASYVLPKLAFVGEHVPLDGGTSVLDVGCGNGIFTHHLAQRGARVIGLDPTANLLRHNPHPLRVRGDSRRLPFRDDAFDVVFEANVLHHVEEREQVVREMRRVARRHVVFIEPNRRNPLMLAFGLLVREERGLLRSSRRTLEALLRACDLAVTRTLVTGMISQNNTPELLLPLLSRFDRPIWWGEYVVIVAEKRDGTR